MQIVTDFIANFKLSHYSLETIDLIVAAAILVVIMVLSKSSVSYLHGRSWDIVRKVVEIISIGLICGFCSLLMLQAVLNEEYMRAFVSILPVCIPVVRKIVGRLYDRYDNLVDKVVDRD